MLPAVIYSPSNFYHYFFVTKYRTLLRMSALAKASLPLVRFYPHWANAMHSPLASVRTSFMDDPLRIR